MTFTNLTPPKNPPPNKLVSILDRIEIPGVEIGYLGDHGIHLIELRKGGVSKRGTLNLEYAEPGLVAEIHRNYRLLTLELAGTEFLVDGKPIGAIKV